MTDNNSYQQQKFVQTTTHTIKGNYDGQQLKTTVIMTDKN